MAEGQGITLGVMATGTAGGNGARTPARRDWSFERLLRLVSRFGSWLQARQDRVADGFFVRTSDGLALYLVGTTQAYDFGLSRELSEFAAPFVSKGWLTGATLLPANSPEQLAAFFNPGDALRIKVG